MAKLRITLGEKTVEVELDRPVLTIGRQQGVGLTIPVKEASREHCRLGKLKDGDGWGIQDLKSTNGTVVNDEALESLHHLAHKDTIRIGPSCTIVFLDPPPPKPKKTKPKGPIVLKSKADKLKEERDAAILAKRQKKKEEALERLKQKEAAKEDVSVATGAFEIDSEATLVRMLKDRDNFDKVLAAPDKNVLFGNYLLQKRLQEGGMGVVFKAHHRKQRFDVALKVLRTEMVDEQNIARFKQEAWAISAFDHPNIVKVRDLAKHGGMYYIAMDFIKGDDLLAVGFKRTLTFWQVMEAIDKMADVLRLVHAKNIWHRDIKPQNIMLDRKGEVRLIDFGIATVEREQDDATKTAEGLIMGTPAFLSPEQAARGKMGQIDGRADLYSLGAVMYYLLTGRRPFTGRSALEILKKNMTEMPPHPLEVDDMAPDGLADIAMRLLAKKPEDRFQTAKQLQQALAAWRKTPDGREEAERHKKIMKLRARKAKLMAQKKKEAKKKQ